MVADACDRGLVGLVSCGGADAVLGIVAVGLAGIVIPRAIDSFIETLATNELTLTLMVSGVVLLLTFTLLRLTAFQTQNGNPT